MQMTGSDNSFFTVYFFCNYDACNGKEKLQREIILQTIHFNSLTIVP